MNKYYRLACVTFLLVAFVSPAVACTQTESEDKVMEVIYALSDMLRRNPDKAGTMAKKFEQVLGDAKQPAPDARATQAAIDKLCKEWTKYSPSCADRAGVSSKRNLRSGIVFVKPPSR